MDENAIGALLLGAAIKVHTRLGPGLLESAYQTCLAHELRKSNLEVLQEVSIPIRYDGIEIDSYSVAPRPVFSDDPAVQPVVMTPGPIAGATVRILGRALAGEEAFACTPVPPTDLGGTSVTVNGNPIQLLYVSASQIYAQLPFNVDGNVTVRVTTANGSSEMSF